MADQSIFTVEFIITKTDKGDGLHVLQQCAGDTLKDELKHLLPLIAKQLRKIGNEVEQGILRNDQ